MAAIAAEGDGDGEGGDDVRASNAAKITVVEATGAAKPRQERRTLNPDSMKEFFRAKKRSKKSEKAWAAEPEVMCLTVDL